MKHTGLVLLLLSSCTPGMMAAATSMGRTPAPNPLRGQPLEYARQSPSAPYQGSSACTTWPIEDHVKVTATSDQICIDASVSKVADASSFRSARTEDAPVSFHADPLGDSFSVGTSNGGPPAMAAGGQVMPTTRKLGTCDHEAKEIWVTTYSGCVPNKSPKGTPVLTNKSTYFDAGNLHGWKLDPATGT